MGIMLWVAIGMATGLGVPLLMPGTGAARLGPMLGVGVIGALLGGFIGMAMGLGQVTSFDIRSLMMALGSAIVAVFGCRTLASRALA